MKDHNIINNDSNRCVLNLAWKDWIRILNLSCPAVSLSQHICFVKFTNHFCNFEMHNEQQQQKKISTSQGKPGG